MTYELAELEKFWLDNETDSLCLCTIIAKTKQAPLAIGKKMMITRDGRWFRQMLGDKFDRYLVDKIIPIWSDLPCTLDISCTDKPQTNFLFKQDSGGVLTFLLEILPLVADKKLYLPYGEPETASGVSVVLSDDGIISRKFATDILDNDCLYFDPWVRSSDHSWL